MRSKLFVPGSRPELFAKALAGAADAISFDLQDAVEEGRKDDARGELARLLGALSPQRKTLIVRVNGIGTRHLDADLDAVVRAPLGAVNLPLVESPDDVRAVAERLDRLERARGLARHVGVLVNIESPRGLRRAAEIACAHPRVIGLQIGFGDLFEPLGIAPGESAAMQSVRVAVRFAAGEAGLPAYDGAFVAIDDPEGYRREADAARRLGFAGKSCIHPTQVPLANEAFAPGPEEVRRALAVVRAADDALARGIGAFVVDGRLVDGPFIAGARRVVALARSIGMAVDDGASGSGRSDA